MNRGSILILEGNATRSNIGVSVLGESGNIWEYTRRTEDIFLNLSIRHWGIIGFVIGKEIIDTITIDSVGGYTCTTDQISGDLLNGIFSSVEIVGFGCGSQLLNATSEDVVDILSDERTICNFPYFYESVLMVVGEGEYFVVRQVSIGVVGILGESTARGDAGVLVEGVSGIGSILAVEGTDRPVSGGIVGECFG